jgi:lipid-A-disaccharide synthase
MKRLLKAPFISLPNLLAGKALVPEILQDEVTPEILGQAVLDRLNQTTAQTIQQSFAGLHREIKQGASRRAAAAIAELIDKGRY